MILPTWFFCYVKGSEGMSTENLKEELNRMPFVKSVAVTWQEISSGYSGIPIYINGKHAFTGWWNHGDFDYLATMGIPLVEGKNFDGPKQIIVSETYVKKMNWTDGAVGKFVENGDSTALGTIVGVMKDVEENAYREPEPIVFMWR
ncbi:MAG: hypothetical protein LUE93_10830 [Bacteroides sp.]|nr:hypothetical protein [Bacteroides sp.]